MEPKTIEQVLELSPEAVGVALLRRREDQWFDRKSVRIKPIKLAETLVGMGNAEGGLVVIGLSDDQIEGVDSEPGRVNELRQAHMQHTVPPVRTDATLLPCRNSVGAADHLLLLSVRSGEAVHTLKSDACFLRVGDETRRLSFHQRQELQYDKGFAQFDSTPLRDVGIGDLDRELLEQFSESLSLADVDRALNARSILDRHGAVTVGGYLLFARNAQELFPEAYVRVLRYEGVERGTGARQRLVHDEACAGPIPRQIECAAHAIERLAPSRRQLASSGRFERRTLIPTDAWLEAVVNAVIHRSYSLGGGTTSVSTSSTTASRSRAPAAFPASPRSAIHGTFRGSPATRGSHGSRPIWGSVRSSAKESAECSRRCASPATANPSTSRRRPAYGSRWQQR